MASMVRMGSEYHLICEFDSLQYTHNATNLYCRHVGRWSGSWYYNIRHSHGSSGAIQAEIAISAGCIVNCELRSNGRLLSSRRKCTVGFSCAAAHTQCILPTTSSICSELRGLDACFDCCSWVWWTACFVCWVEWEKRFILEPIIKDTYLLHDILAL